jgi:hypothetical protein
LTPDGDAKSHLRIDISATIHNPAGHDRADIPLWKA